MTKKQKQQQPKKDIQDIKSPKLLITIVTSDAKKYCQTTWFAHALTLKEYYPNVEYLIMDNSKTKKNADLIRSYGFDNVFWNSNPNKLDTRHLMAECNELLRLECLKRDFDYVLNWESDQYVNLTVVPFMVNYMETYKIHILTLPYFIGVDKKYMLIRESVKDEEKSTDKHTHFKEVQLTKEQAFLKFTGNVEPTIFTAIGFLIHSKEVVQKIKWHIGEGNDGFSDVTFGNDTTNAGYQWYCYYNANAVQQHWQSDWTYRGRKKH